MLLLWLFSRRKTVPISEQTDPLMQETSVVTEKLPFTTGNLENDSNRKVFKQKPTEREGKHVLSPSEQLKYHLEPPSLPSIRNARKT